MPRLSRKQLEDSAFFHVTSRGAGGSKIFEDELDRLYFADRFWDAVLRFELDCLVAVEVGTHYHALFECERDSLSAAMHQLNGSYARRFNVRHGRTGHLFGDRFSTWIPESERHLEVTIPYILWNPVRAGLCDHPSEWQWSWLEPERAANAWPDLLPANPSACPMGQALGRARERQRRARLRRAGGRNGKVPAMAMATPAVERDAL
jgi:REP element-mobilizing transposase RayT